MKALAIMIALAVLLPAVAAAQEELVGFEIRGSITTDAGQPVANASVQLTFIRLDDETAGRALPSDSRLVVSSDASGNYHFQVNIDPNWSDFELRIINTPLDQRRFPLPPARVLTDVIRNTISSGTFHTVVNWSITGRPGYEKEQEEIKRYGENSDKAKLIKVRGLPDKIRQFSRGIGQQGELWYYYADGVVVRFLGDKRDRDFYFRPQPANNSTRNN